jgi:hypothetical protein
MNPTINSKLEALRRHLDEGKTDIKAVVTKVRGMTAENDHTGARVYLAQTLLPRSKLAKALEGLEAIQAFHGHSTSGVRVAMKELETELWDELKHELSDEDYQAVHDAL